MARRGKASGAEDFVHVVALAPWWVGVLLAVLAYALLHRYAESPVTAAARPGQAGQLVVQTFTRTLALYGQYIVPALCLLAAGISAWRRRTREALVVKATHSPAAAAVDAMSWREFELLVGEGFRQQGYRVDETGGGGADGGVDLVLSKAGRTGSERFLVQCKQWRAFKVGVDVVRELYGAMAASGAAGGFVVTSGRFTAEAVQFAAGRNIVLVDGAKLQGLLRQGKAAFAAAAPSSTSAASMPACPVCAKPMVRRAAKRGANVGAEFWGCTGFPACRGTRPAD